MFRFNNERTIYMEGLPFEATEESITAFFAKVGPLAGLRLPRWHDSGRLRGYGHAEFATADEASRAMKELNGAYRCNCMCDNVVVMIVNLLMISVMRSHCWTF